MIWKNDTNTMTGETLVLFSHQVIRKPGFDSVGYIGLRLTKNMYLSEWSQIGEMVGITILFLRKHHI